MVLRTSFTENLEKWEGISELKVEKNKTKQNKTIRYFNLLASVDDGNQT